MTPAPSARDLLGLAVGLAGAAASTTVIFLGMRAVMDVGGACADGGAYQIAVHCPDGAGVGLTFGIFAMLAFWAIAARYGMRVGGVWANAPIMGWAGLFVSLGWNFLEAGFVSGDITGWLLGAMFWAMGLVPLVFVLLPGNSGRLSSGSSGSERRSFNSVTARRDGFTGYDGPREQPTRYTPTPAATDALAVREQLLATIARDLAAVETRSAPGVTVEPGPEADSGQDTQALVAHLERLTDLHASGQLDDATYEAAKSAIVKALGGVR
jgi:hypothetical protein